MGASDYGIFFLGITVFNLLAVFSQCGIEDGLIRFLGRYIQKNEIVKATGIIRLSLFLAVGLGLLFGGICFFSSDIIAKEFFHKPELTNILRYLSLGIPIFALMTVSVASIRGFKIVLPYILVRKIFMPFISFVFAIVVLAMGYGLRELTVTYIIAIGCSAALATFLLVSFLSPFKEGSDSQPERSQYLSFIRSAFFVNILLFLFAWSDVIILGALRPSQDAGIYFASKKTAMILGILLISLNTIFAPVISHLYSGHKYKELKQAFKTGTQWILILGLPLFLIISFFPREILSLFGQDFKTGQMCLMILAFGQLFSISVGSVGYLLMMTGHQRWMVFNSIIFVILTIFLTLLLVPRYGLLGAAYANSSAIILANFVVLLEVYFLLKLHPYNIRYFKILFFGVITAVLAYFIRHFIPNNASVISSMMEAIGILVIFFTLIVLFGLDEIEKKLLASVKQKLLPSCIQGPFWGKK